MASRRITHSILGLAALAMAVAVPMPGMGNMGMGMPMGMPMGNQMGMMNPMMGGNFGMGMPFGLGGLGPVGVGSSFKGGVPQPLPVVPQVPRAPVLNGVQRKVNAQNMLVQGMSATVKPSNDVPTAPQGFSGGVSPFNMGMMGQMGQMGMFPQMGMPVGGFSQQGSKRQELEVKVDFILPQTTPRDLVVVFVKNAPPSELSQCAAGPIMAQSPRSKGGQGMPMGLPSSVGGFPMGMGMGGMAGLFSALGVAGMGNVQPTQADFGVISEVKAIPGMNSFKIQGLGDIVHSMEDLAGMAVALCDNVVMGVTGPECSSTPMCCVKLGYTENEEPLLIGQVGDYASTPAAGAAGAGSVY